MENLKNTTGIPKKLTLQKYLCNTIWYVSKQYNLVLTLKYSQSSYQDVEKCGPLIPPATVNGANPFSY